MEFAARKGGADMDSLRLAGEVTFTAKEVGVKAGEEVGALLARAMRLMQEQGVARDICLVLGGQGPTRNALLSLGPDVMMSEAGGAIKHGYERERDRLFNGPPDDALRMSRADDVLRMGRELLYGTESGSRFFTELRERASSSGTTPTALLAADPALRNQIARAQIRSADFQLATDEVEARLMQIKSADPNLNDIEAYKRIWAAFPALFTRWTLERRIDTKEWKFAETIRKERRAAAAKAERYGRDES